MLLQMNRVSSGNTNWSFTDLLLCFSGILSSVLLHDYFKQILGFYNNVYALILISFLIPIFIYYIVLLRVEISKKDGFYVIVKYFVLSLTIALLTSNLIVNIVRVQRLKEKAEHTVAKDYVVPLSIIIPQRTGYECATFRFRNLKSVIPISGRFYSEFVAKGGIRYIKISVKELTDEYAVLQEYTLLE